MNAPPVTDSTEICQRLIDRYFPSMAKHYAAAYQLTESPPESLRQAAADSLAESAAKTPRRAVDAILAVLDHWRTNAQTPVARAA
ncbi:MAG: hypothetical protein MPJ50_11820 [Pirellulales bacterium]|nr:hypothetical protein [Pirellulales bacterium]